MSHRQTTYDAVVSVVCNTGEMQAKVEQDCLSLWDAMRISLTGTGKVDKLVIMVRHPRPVEEIFIPAPNADDVKYAHPLQTICLGYATHHPQFRFGAQWLYTPPPLVLPMRTQAAWHGVAIAAKPGRNSFSSVIYEPVDRDTYKLIINYDGYYGETGDAVSVLFTRDPAEDPYVVIRKYAEQLRMMDYAPTPRRQPANWWKDTMACTWGEQCNIYHTAQSNPRKEHGQHSVSSYETQANQMRWLQRLLDKDIPLGVVSTSDKWQFDRYRLAPDEGRYEDFRGFADWNHRAGRHVIAWWGLWNVDGAPLEWCIRDKAGKPLSIDPEHPEYRKVLVDDITKLLSPSGYDYDGFFLDFTAHQPYAAGLTKSGDKWGIELLHDYVKLIYEASKAAKPDAMIMTHCPHPYFADVTDVLRLNDWAIKRPNVVEQGRYRQGIAAACSDWLINTDNWIMYDATQWREYLEVQPELGIPATWFTHGVFGEGTHAYDAFTEADYSRWREIWTAYRVANHLPELTPRRT